MSIIKGTNQIVAGFGGTKRSIGEVYFSQSALATDNSGALPLFTGETIASANTIYPEFYNWVTSHTELQCTAAEYEASLTTYGECAKYVIGDGSLRLPLIRNYIKAANTTEGIKNIEAGLPNITAKIMGTTYGNLADTYVNASGACRTEGNGGAAAKGGTEIYLWKHDFDASRSSAVYGRSDAVTPASTTLYPWVVAYTAAIPASTAQAAEFQQGLSGKADTNLGNTAPSQSFKEMSVGWGMPDYSAGVTLTKGIDYTAPSDGYIMVSATTSNNQSTNTFIFKIDNITILNREMYSYSGMNAGVGVEFCIPISKGSVANLTTSGIVNTYMFYPFKGVN